MVLVISYLLLHCLYFTAGSFSTVEPKKNLIKNILRSNGDSLKQLASKFPNHVIEMQVEMVDPTPEPPKSSLSMRSGDKNETGATNPSTTTAPVEQGTVPDNRPVYMSDLKEAVEALEKRINNKNTPADDASKPAAYNTNEAVNNAKNTMDDGNHPLLKKDLWEIFDIASQYRNTPPNRFKNLKESAQAPQDYDAANSNNNPSGVKSIGDVLNLIKKGVKVQFDITRPTDRNLDWIQVKVPNVQ